MRFSPINRALLRGAFAGAVVFTGTACSRSDRTESGSNNSSTVQPDTSSNAVQQPTDTGTATGAVSDTAAVPAQSSTEPRAPARPNTPRAETAAPSDSGAGYRPMERDTSAAPNQHADSARVTTDSSVSAVPDTGSTEMAVTTDTAVIADTAAAGYVEMARDTSPVADQADTAAAPSADSNAQVAVAVADSAESVTPDSTEVVRVRPPEDSTEILGNVTTNEAADETADEQIINPEDEVGAAAVSSDVTGAEAVALMSREGVRCAIADPETNEAVRWDMSSTPVALNPCGMGSMNLSKVWTDGQRGGGVAGQ
ncbi:MAG: hypothetical protein ABI703_00295 [Gemmatimonadales bacterium]